MNAAGPGRRVGLFGGAFDPPHHTHRALAQAAIEQLALDELRIVPTGQAWHKARPLTPAVHRLALCRLAFGDLPGVCVDDRETRRHGPSYTADTLAELATEAAPGTQWFVVLGADQWQAFTTWHRWRDILRQATLAVAQRPLCPVPGPEAATEVAPRPGADPEQAGAPASTLPDVPCVSLYISPSPLSSTAVRAHLTGRHGTAWDAPGLVPEGVARYICEHHLYRTPT